MDVKIANTADFQRLEPLLLAVEHHHVGLEPEIFRPISAYDQDHFEQLIENEHEIIFYIEVEGVAAGVLIASERESPTTPMFVNEVFTVVEELSVAQQFQRQGVGQRLMEAVEEWAKSRGRSTIQLSVWAQNSGALQFYEHLGYVPKLIRYHKKIID